LVESPTTWTLIGHWKLEASDWPRTFFTLLVLV
jgi:hypothetical protein